MPLLFSKLKEIAVFFYTLILLLVFNLYFNLNYNWPGISSIVRVYVLVFSFYLIFIFASLDLPALKEDYINKFGRKGKLLLFAEIRVIPFLIIYLITILFTIIADIKNLEQPTVQLLSLLNGRHSNNIIYSWLLLIILSLKKRPGIAIPLWITVPILYGLLDWWIFSSINNGLIISFVKIVKAVIFLFLLFSEFFGDRKKCVISSLVIGILFFIFTVSFFSGIFRYSDRVSIHRKEAGLILIKMGITYPVDQLKDIVIQTNDIRLLNDLLWLSGSKKIIYKQEQWEQILFSNPAYMTEKISGYLLNEKINLSYGKIVSYAYAKSKEKSVRLDKLSNFIVLAARFCNGHEEDILNRLKKGNRNFKLWAIRILAENRSIEAIPVLLIYLTDIDDKLANHSYEALKKITDIDPAAALEKRRNDPDTISIFNEYYRKYIHSGKLPKKDKALL